MFKLKGYTHYINGVVGHDFKLTLLEKIRILFSKKLSVVFISANKKSYTQGNVDNMPRIKTLQRLADALGVSVDELCNGNLRKKVTIK